MRVFFIGCVLFSQRALLRLLNENIPNLEIVGIGTKQESRFNADFCSLAPLAKSHNIPFNYIENINSPETRNFIDSCRPDVIYCFGWSALVGKVLLDAYPIIGFHPANLPNNRGRHPLIWALVLGLKESASTFFIMDEGADSGAILSQKRFMIAYEDTAKSLYDKVTAIALTQIVEFSTMLAEESSPDFRQVLSKKSTPQDPKSGNLWRKRGAKDGVIDFRMNSRAIYNLVRALTRPYVGAECVYGECLIKIWAAREAECDLTNIEPGKVLKADSLGVLVKTNDGAILLTEHEFKILPKPGEYL